MKFFFNDKTLHIKMVFKVQGKYFEQDENYFDPTPPAAIKIAWKAKV